MADGKKKTNGLKGLNPHQLELRMMLSNHADHNGELRDPKLARIILRSGRELSGLLIYIDEDGGITLERRKPNKFNGFVYVDFREVVVLEW